VQQEAPARLVTTAICANSALRPSSRRSQWCCSCSTAAQLPWLPPAACAPAACSLQVQERAQAGAGPLVGHRRADRSRCLHCRVVQQQQRGPQLPHLCRLRSARAASRTVGGGTLGAQATSAAHSSLYQAFHAAFWWSRLQYLASPERLHLSGLAQSRKQ
jgi:hypothetical protein